MVSGRPWGVDDVGEKRCITFCARRPCTSHAPAGEGGDGGGSGGMFFFFSTLAAGGQGQAGEMGDKQLSYGQRLRDGDGIGLSGPLPQHDM